MTPALHHECTRVPVTGIAFCGALLIAAEGPFLRFYHAKDSRYIASKRVFKAQAVHGISIYPEGHGGVTKLVIWGGRLVRALDISFASSDSEDLPLNTCLSDVAKAPDWIFDLAPRPTSLEDEAEYEKGVCVAITAHNSLLQIVIQRQDIKVGASSNLALSILELTSSSRSILYSAHVFYESADCVLVAAGTAFGEIIYWSWTCAADVGPVSSIHRIFTGHEGSVFGVRISKELPLGCCQSLKRIIASCSDDRTIRIWDVSAVATGAAIAVPSDRNVDVKRTQHTGFSNAAFDSEQLSNSDCLAIGWGHTSRVWKVQFLESTPCEGALLLLSAGEDASSRTWKLSQNDGHKAALPYKLLQQDCAAHHSGKNLWSSAIYNNSAGRQQVVCGAADAKITTHPLTGFSNRQKENTVHEYTVDNILSLAQYSVAQGGVETSHVNHRSSKKAEFFRSYCFIDEDKFLLTTNSGKVFIGSLQPQLPSSLGQSTVLSNTSLVDQLEDLHGYSVCVGDPFQGIAFVSSSKGTIYTYTKDSRTLTRICSANGKVGEMFVASTSVLSDRKTVALFATLVGQKEAQLMYVDLVSGSEPFVISSITVPVSESLTGLTITSMAIHNASGLTFVFLGFRRGSVAVYSISNDCATLFRIIEKVHGDETVTAMKWVTSIANASTGHLLSVGRNGALTVHEVNLITNFVEPVYNLTLPIGPNIEGLYFHQKHLLVHGFSSKRWMLYNVTTEEEVMGVDTGGAHRSWTFQPDLSSLGGGALVWTRALSMHICVQSGPNHGVIRPGGHGREIKAVAVSRGPPDHLIATGAEDTDIKLFQYTNDQLTCRRTLRKHTTGIQHLQWSEDGKYLFSSGGCEEFYIWRVRQLPAFMDIGVICQYTYPPESEHSDLRIMSFDVMKSGTAYVIAMVFSDSTMKVYRYNPAAAVRWQLLAKGHYFTSCLTQCNFLSQDIILTAGTDGHAVLWPLVPEVNRPSAGLLSSTPALKWQQPIRIHQSSSKTVSCHHIGNEAVLVVSGGDDGSLAFLLARPDSFTSSTFDAATSYASSSLLVSRAHASAVTSCAILPHRYRIFVLTSGNDEWVRLWEVVVGDPGRATSSDTATNHGEDILAIKRLRKIKTNVADVSSMAVLGAVDGGSEARVLICGVGMEVVRVDWDIGDRVIEDS